MRRFDVYFVDPAYRHMHVHVHRRLERGNRFYRGSVGLFWEADRMADEDRNKNGSQDGLYHRRNAKWVPQHLQDAHRTTHKIRTYCVTAPHPTDYTRAEWLQFAEVQCEMDAKKHAKRQESIRQRLEAEKQAKEEREAIEAVADAAAAEREQRHHQEGYQQQLLKITDLLTNPPPSLRSLGVKNIGRKSKSVMRVRLTGCFDRRVPEDPRRAIVQKELINHHTAEHKRLYGGEPEPGASEIFLLKYSVLPINYKHF